MSAIISIITVNTQIHSIRGQKFLRLKNKIQQNIHSQKVHLKPTDAEMLKIKGQKIIYQEIQTLSQGANFVSKGKLKER